MLPQGSSVKSGIERFATAHMLAMAGDTQLAITMFEMVARHPQTPAEAVPFVRGLQAFLRRDRAELRAQRSHLLGVRATILDAFHDSGNSTYCEAYQRIVPRRESDELAFLAFSQTESEEALRRVAQLLRGTPSFA